MDFRPSLHHDAGRLPRARLLPGAYGNVVRAEPDAARVVRVTGTLASEELLRVVRRLVPTS